MRFDNTQFKSILDKEIKRISKEIPVFFLSKKDIKQLQKEKNDAPMDTRYTDGVIAITKIDKNRKCKMPRMYIWIRKGYDFLLPKRLYHEYGHYKCIEKGCKCIERSLNKGEDVSCEYHADVFALKEILKLSKKVDVNTAYLILFFTTSAIEDEIKIKKSVCPIHKESLVRAVKTKAYKNIIKFRNSLVKKVNIAIIKG